jgi:hypothetical protein
MLAADTNDPTPHPQASALSHRNAIDFHIQVLELSFHDAMRQITGT